MKMKFGVILFLFSLFGAKFTYAQSIEFLGQSSKASVAADEVFRLIYTVNVEAKFTVPDLKDFKLLSGPAQSSRSQMTYVNGQMKNSFTISYYLNVRPKKEGDFTIPPASITYNGKIYKSNTVKVTVTAASGNGQVDNSNPQNNTRVNTNKFMFCTISTNKSTVYKGEPVLVTYKLYSRSQYITDYEINLGTQKDVWSQELSNNKQPWPTYNESVNGLQYIVFTIRKEIALPQRSGKLKLEPFDMMAIARISAFESSRFDLVSNSPTIEVLETPANAPAGYNNAVGKYSIEASVNKEEVNVNDGIDLNLKIKCTNGNIKLIEPSKFEFPTDFEVYDPEVNDKTSINASGMSGTKEYKYLVIPRHSGDFTIDPIKFSYFDLETKQYVSLATPSFKIKVNKSADEEEQGGVLSNSKDDVKILDKEIHYLKSDVGSVEKDFTYFTGSTLYYSIISMPPILFLLLIFLQKRKVQNFDANQDKEKKATKVVAKQLQRVQDLLKQNNTAEFYTELLKGIQNYYCDKFSLQTVDFHRQKINDILKSKGVTENTTNRFLKLVENCELARYAPMTSANENSNFEEASQVINQIEQELKA